ncbi:MAG: tetratricopeptide repeat protein [Bacteroidetes bacterium]|nr:tetratricopeptide repeat protein [Bacteroidota bacterium]
MRKIFLFALILGITTQLVGQRPGGPPPGGQRPSAPQQQPQPTVNKDAEAAMKAYQKAKDEVTGKKAQDPAAWVRFGKALTNVYEAPIKNLWIGLSSMEAKVLLKDYRATGTEQKTIEGETYDVVHYTDKDLYYAEDGRLSFWEITKPLLSEDILGEAYKAFDKAYELDAKGTQKKEVNAGISGLQTRYVNEAMAANAVVNYSLSSQAFGNALRCSEHPSVNKLDTILVFYAGYTAFLGNEYQRSIEYVQRAIDLGWTQDGAAFSILANCYKNLDHREEVERILAEGFTKYPSNQSILIDLINLYIENNEDPEKIMEYIHSAQQNEPTNPSLFYAEGNVWQNLQEIDKAMACYQKAIEVDPKYVFSYYSMGVMLFNAAVDIQNRAAEELDDAKYYAMIEQLDVYIDKAVDPFEQCFSLTTDEGLKDDVALYLKNIYYRLQGKGDAYQAAFEKYNAYVQKDL